MTSSSPPEPTPPGRETTRWGDREQRRTDILDAARSRIEERGYMSLNMRDLAADAGISPATLYSYFATKVELFITLYTEAVHHHTDEVRAVLDTEPDLATLLEKLLVLYVDIYGRYGRYFTLWAAARPEDTQAIRTGRAVSPQVRPEVGSALAAAGRESNRVTLGGIRDAAERDGRHLVDDTLVPSLLWSYMTGVADHITSQRTASRPHSAEQLVSFAAQRLVHTLTDPDLGAG